MRPGRAAGVTLVELLVVLVILGTMTALVGITWPPEQWLPPDGTQGIESIASLRNRALESGRAIRAVISTRRDSVPVIAFPDGRVMGGEKIGVNPLTGETLNAGR